MLEKEASNKALIRFFRRAKIAELDGLYRVLETGSRMSVFRRLMEVGYLSSYTHTGKFYTLSEIPQFDENGLWFFHGVGFSKAGTLKQTIVDLVHGAETGRRQKELEGLLRIRVHNTLHRGSAADMGARPPKRRPEEQKPPRVTKAVRMTVMIPDTTAKDSAPVTAMTPTRRRRARTSLAIRVGPMRCSPFDTMIATGSMPAVCCPSRVPSRIDIDRSVRSLSRRLRPLHRPRRRDGGNSKNTHLDD